MQTGKSEYKVSNGEIILLTKRRNPHEPTRNIHIHPKAIPHPPERTTFMEVQAESDMIGNYSEM